MDFLQQEAIKRKRPLMTVALVSLLALSVPGHASNFSYTFVEGALGQMMLDRDIIFAGELYDDFAVASVTGSYQVTDVFAVRATATGTSQDSRNTEITQSSFNLSANFPINVVPGRLDLVPLLGLTTVDAEFCDNSRRNYYSCYTEDDSGALYGAMARFWALPNQLEINGTVADSSMDGAAVTYNLGGAYWFERRHSVRANYGWNEHNKTFTVGYAFSW